MIKRWLLFTYSCYYPCGGWCDFNDSFETKEEAETAGLGSKDDLWHIVDIEEGKII